MIRSSPGLTPTARGYDPRTVFSSIDRTGRYAYGNQPRIAHWNLARLAEAMLPLLGEDQDAAVDEAQEAVATFGPLFERFYYARLRQKLGLDGERADDLASEIDIGRERSPLLFRTRHHTTSVVKALSR
jgi:uncharacterized protein YdiU (UPF0061 family)